MVFSEIFSALAMGAVADISAPNAMAGRWSVRQDGEVA
jgi:hypothetical protein